MATKTNGHKQKNLVVIQLSGGNDYLNTLVPYQDGLYYDFRPNMGLKGEDLIPVDDKLAFNSHMGTFKNLFDQDKMAVMMGIGYPEPNRSHFRSMDIWHTAEPLEAGKEGWLGRAIRDIDPGGANPVTAVNIGQGLPRGEFFGESRKAWLPQPPRPLLGPGLAGLLGHRHGGLHPHRLGPSSRWLRGL